MNETSKFPRRPFYVNSERALRALPVWLREIPAFSAVAPGEDRRNHPIIKIGREKVSSDGLLRRWRGQDLIICADAGVRDRAVSVILAEFGDAVHVAGAVAQARAA
jgi:hypothetical protein